MNSEAGLPFRVNSKLYRRTKPQEGHSLLGAFQWARDGIYTNLFVTRPSTMRRKHCVHTPWLRVVRLIKTGAGERGKV